MVIERIKDEIVKIVYPKAKTQKAPTKPKVASSKTTAKAPVKKELAKANPLVASLMSNGGSAKNKK